MSFFTTVFITIFTIVDPLGTSAVFAGLTSKLSTKETYKIALQATVIAVAVLLFFGFIGKIVLEHMGISSEAFKVAGGLLLFYTAFRMVLGGHEKNAPSVSDTSNTIAVFPMAIPLMAGPGCATAFILLLETAQAQETSSLMVVLAMLAVANFTDRNTH